MTNTAVYLAALDPGDTILSLSLAHGGHLSHGMKINISGRLYTIVHYGVEPDTFQSSTTTRCSSSRRSTARR